MQKDAAKYVKLADGFDFVPIKIVLTEQDANSAEASEIRRLREQGVRLYNRVTGKPAANRIFWAALATKAKRATSS
jgi:hypothetical protein